MTCSMARTLGLKGTSSSFDLIDAIRKGLKKEAVDHVADALEISPSEISRSLHVSAKTLHRYRPDETLSLDASDHLIQICKVYARALDVFGEKRKAVGWLLQELDSTKSTVAYQP